MSPAVREEKIALRKTILTRRDALPPDNRLTDSARITSSLLELDHYRAARCVAAYVSFGSEFDTSPFLRSVLAEGKQLVLPRVDAEKKNIEMRAVTDLEHQLAPGAWGIREPLPALCPQVDLREIALALVPGVAFTRKGGRLGYGKGFYDRLIARLNPDCRLVAAAFSCQLVARIPTTATDQQVHLIVTESEQFST